MAHLGPAAGLLEILDPHRLDVDLFLGRQPDVGAQRVFGGQVAAQALVAGARTVDSDRPVHSLHSYFLRPGDASVPIIYDVERLRDGRSFSTRRVTARQHGKPIYEQLLSFHEPEPGVAHQSRMPAVAGPETGQHYADVMEKRGHPRAPSWEREWAALEVQWVGHNSDMSDQDQRESVVRLWLRVLEHLPDDPVLHAAAFAYASDISLLGSTLVAHDIEPGALRAASLDHSIWFHRPFDSTEWWLYDQVSPCAESARGFARGTVFTPNGVVVASVAQEVLIRVEDRG